MLFVEKVGSAIKIHIKVKIHKTDRKDPWTLCEMRRNNG